MLSGELSFLSEQLLKSPEAVNARLVLAWIFGMSRCGMMLGGDLLFLLCVGLVSSRKAVAMCASKLE